MMDGLIESLTILRKYDNPDSPTNCEHDTLWVNVSPESVSQKDIHRLGELGFFADTEGFGFTSSKFGSC